MRISSPWGWRSDAIHAATFVAFIRYVARVDAKRFPNQLESGAKTVDFGIVSHPPKGRHS
ncbi:hypothetical protein ACFFJ7_11175 [Pseudochelatococcus lubricantis]